MPRHARMTSPWTFGSWNSGWKSSRLTLLRLPGESSMDVVIPFGISMAPWPSMAPHTAPADFPMAKTYVRHRIRAPHGCAGESSIFSPRPWQGMESLSDMGWWSWNTKIPTISDGMLSDWEWYKHMSGCETRLAKSKQPLSHSATLPERLDQPVSHSGRVADAATQPLSPSARVAGAATQPLSHSEWLSGWRAIGV